jgi:outer membrane protein assembly factor BamB
VAPVRSGSEHDGEVTEYMTTSRLRRVSAVVTLTIGIGSLSTATTAQDWPSWRGPDDTGMGRGDAPVSWSDVEGVRWRAAIPGRGHSSPVVWGDQVFVTTAVPTGRQAAHRFVLLSIDRATGNLLWERTAAEATPHEGHHRQYGSFASASPVTDGEHIYASFGSRGLYCYDLEGTLVWQKDLGQMRKFLQFGEGTPLVLDDDRLIVKFDHEGDSFVVALDKATGAELWRAERDEITSWSPPLVVEHDGRKQVVVAATRRVRSYDFESGELLWEAAGLGRNQIPAPVHQGDLVFVMSGYTSPNLMAIRLGGQGDLTGSDAIVWQNKQANAYTPSPVLFENQLYVLTDGGVLTNFDATTGEVHYRQRLPGPSNFKASPVAVDDKLYLSSEEGQVLVVRLGPTFELLATNTLEGAVFIAAPAITNGEILLRSLDSLYAVGSVE